MSSTHLAPIISSMRPASFGQAPHIRLSVAEIHAERNSSALRPDSLQLLFAPQVILRSQQYWITKSGSTSQSWPVSETAFPRFAGDGMQFVHRNVDSLVNTQVDFPHLLFAKPAFDLHRQFPHYVVCHRRCASRAMFLISLSVCRPPAKD